MTSSTFVKGGLQCQKLQILVNDNIVFSVLGFMCNVEEFLNVGVLTSIVCKTMEPLFLLLLSAPIDP